MITITFRNNELEQLAEGIGDHKYPTGIGKKYRFVLQHIEQMESIKEIRAYQWREAKRKNWDRADQVGIRLNKGWRLMLKFPKDKQDIWIVTLVREVSNHYE